MTTRMSERFPRYTEFDPAVPVWCVTPGLARCFHRFFDTSPISPSGRFLAVTRYPSDTRMPVPGEPAEIVLVDLETAEERILTQTHGWDTQLGAQAQWGVDDSQLFFNDMDIGTWRPFGILMDPATGRRRRLDGTVYMVSPDGRHLASPCVLRTGLTQAGYGVIAPAANVPVNRGAAADDGLFITDTETGACRLVASIADMVAATRPALALDNFDDGDCYGFHVKWNAQGDRIMYVLRWKHRKTGALTHNLITLRPDGTDMRVAMSASEWTGKGGHHPTWCPDGVDCTMNLKFDRKTMRFVRFRYDGSRCAVMTEAVLGSGHPSLHPNGRHVVTDSYPWEPMAFGDGTTPIRLVDVEHGTETTLARIQTVPPFAGPKSEMRVDPHPAWDRAFRRVVFNACPGGRRGVFLADVTGRVEGP